MSVVWMDGFGCVRRADVVWLVDFDGIWIGLHGLPWLGWVGLDSVLMDLFGT